MTEKNYDATDAVIKEVRHLLDNGSEISAPVARKLLLTLSVANQECIRETNVEVKKVNGRLKKVEEAAKEWKRHPSLLWLLHNKTKLTVSVIVVVFVLLSAFYVSGVRAVIMEWLGLPPLIP